jgi:hypothetical protein
MSETHKISAILCSDVFGYSRLAGALRALRSCSQPTNLRRLVKASPFECAPSPLAGRTFER